MSGPTGKGPPAREPGANRPVGDVELGLRARALLGRRHPVAAVAAVGPDGLRTAAWGAGLDADFEIGSVAKGITGLLYADALDRGEIDRATTLGDCLPVLLGGEVAGITLASITIHRSGLGTLPSDGSSLRSGLQARRHGTNPYAGTLAELLERVRTESPGTSRPRYSNLAFQLLGHALARRAGTDFQGLVHARIADPLGLGGLHVPYHAGDLRPQALIGETPSGRPCPPWLGEAVGPAGGVRATIGDLGGLLTALLDGTAPGLAALDPVAPFGRRARIGAGWITVEHRGRRVTWHNGGTGGFRSWVGVDRRAGTGVAVVSAVHRSVDPAGFALLAQLTDEAGGAGSRQPVAV